MKISLEWLSEYLPGTHVAGRLGDALTHGGLPVEVIEPFGDDLVMDVEVTSNRGDCLSHVGMARELSALLGLEFRDVKTSAAANADEKAAVKQCAPPGFAATVTIEAAELCPHYTAQVIRGVKIGPSPAWMQRRLESIGVRPVNNVVDVTNYVMFEMGQPLHTFNFDGLYEKRIVVRRAMPGEVLKSLDGHDRKLLPDMLVIADAKRAVALAGVMGGKDSEVTDGTVNILLESARFDALSIRKTARVLAMKSDSSYRFERKIDPTLPLRASRRAAELIVQTAGGELAGPVVEAGAQGCSPKTLSVRLARMRQVLGIELPVQDVLQAFGRLQFAPILKGDVVECNIPSARLDVNIEVDLIEEAIRVLGYDRVPVRDEISIRVTPPEADARAIELIRRTMIGGGYFESITFSWASDSLAGHFIPQEAASLVRADARIRKADASLRPSILPGLLEAIFRNQSVGNGQVKLFEIGSTFWYDATGKIDERRRLSLVGGDDEHDVRGVIEQLLGRLDRTRVVAVRCADGAGFDKGVAGVVTWGDVAVGRIGRIEAAVCEKLSLRGRPFAAELELSALIAGCQHVPQLMHLPKYPAVRRDLSLIVAETVGYDAIEKLVRELSLTDLEAVEFVTTYRGKPLEQGQKSVTIALAFRSPTTTLTAEQVEAAMQRAVEAAKAQLNASQRV